MLKIIDVLFFVASVSGQLFPIEQETIHNIYDLTIPTVREGLDDCSTRYYRYGRDNLASPVLGTPVELNEFAHMAAIGWTQSQGGTIDWNCGGSLISDEWVLSAAHCTFVGGKEPDKIRLGDRNPFTKLDDEIAQQFDVVQVVRHPNYRSSSSYFDIALFKMSGSISPQKNVLPACLWTDTSTNYVDDFRYEAVGFGKTGFSLHTFLPCGSNIDSDCQDLKTTRVFPVDDLAEFFQKVNLNYVDLDQCRESYGKERRHPDGLVDHQMCARGNLQGDLRPDTCLGDSGGPLQVKLLANGRLTSFIIGVTSFGKSCGLDEPGVYVKVASFRSFIENVTRISFEPRKCMLRYVSLREFQPGLLEIAERSTDANQTNWINSKVHIARDYRHKSYLGKKMPNGRVHWYCGASLVSENWLLTAAHCLSEMTPDFAQVGDLRIYSTADDELAQRFEIQQMIMHPNYRANDVYNDIGLVKLKGFVKLSLTTVPACIWKKEKLPTDTFELVGWGSRVSNLFFIDLPVWEVGNDEVFPMVTSECDLACQVQRTKPLELIVDDFKNKKDEIRYLEINTTVLDNANCDFYYLTKKGGKPIRNTQMCLQNNLFAVPGICDLDIGGPVERKIWGYNEYDSYIFGVNSYGKNCGFGTPAVATRVSSFANWIESNVLGQPMKPEKNVDAEIFFVDNVDVSSRGDSCTIASLAERGVCTLDSECQSGIAYYRSQGEQVQFCGFTPKPLVCCPQTLSNRVGSDRINLRKCTTYEQFRQTPKLSRVEHNKVFSHLAAVGFPKGNNYEYKCWGALITDSYVVTSATCLTITPSQPRVVRLGDHNVGLTTTPTLANIRQVVPHPMYRSRYYYYDIALIQIEPVLLSANVVPACLWSLPDKIPFIGTTVAPVSLDDIKYECQTFGEKKCVAKDPLDKERNLLTLQNDVCKLYYPPDSILTEGIVESQVCAQAQTVNTTETCIRVPGSLYQKGIDTNGKIIPYIVGVYSFNRDCNKDNPAIFTRASSYIDWMEQVINQNTPSVKNSRLYLPTVAAYSSEYFHPYLQPRNHHHHHHHHRY